MTAPGKDKSEAVRHGALRSFAAPVAALAGIALSVASFLIAQHAERNRAEVEFQRRADFHYNALQINLERHLETLEIVRMFFESNTNLTRDEFRALADDIIGDHPAIQVLEWAPRVPGSQRAAFEASAAQSAPGYRINDRDRDGRPFPAPERPEYYPLLYVEPLEANRIVPGFDAAAGKAAAELAQARDVADAVMSAVVPLAQRTNEPGVIVTLPVYDRHQVTNVMARREHIRGVVRGVFRVRDLMEAAWMPLPAAGVDTLVLDSDEKTNRFVFFHPSKVRPAPIPAISEAALRSGLHHEISATIAGRKWLFLFRPVPEWWSSEVRRFPLVLLAGGLAFTFILAAYLRLMVRRTEIVERTVADRTARLEQANTMLNHEIAGRRRTEEELRRSEAQLLAAQRIGRIGSWEVDLRRGTLQWSDEVYRIFGRDPSTFQPGNAEFFESIPADERERVRETSQRAVATGTPYHIVHRIIRPDGTERIVIEHAEIVRDDAGPARMVGTVQDITEQQRAEQRLALERNLLETVVESMPDLIFVKDLQCRFIRANQATLRALGVSSMDQVAGRTDAEILPPGAASRFMEDDARVIQHGIPVVNREETFPGPGGEQIWLLTTKVPFRDAEGRIAGLVGISRDITEHKRRDEERRTMDRKFQETQKLESLGVLAGGIAHDFNNLLTGILGNASLARMDLPAQSPIQPYLEQIELSSQRAAELCKQMLAYSGKGRFVIQPVDLSALVQDTLHLLQLSISKRAVLKLDLARGLPVVMADTTQLRQIVMNLVINASDAINERSGLIVLRTSRLTADREYLADLTGADDLQPGDYVTLEVTDNGSGMSPEIKARIFEPFFTTKFTGRGLGLAAVLGIVRGHKGALKVYSEEGKGTTFKLLLPAAAGAVPEEPAAPRRAGARASGRILVVDDEEAVRTVVARMCTSMGFQVMTAADGARGIEIYKASERDFQAVLLDLTMPKMDGEETFREIRRLNPRACVLLMSGFNEQDAVARFVGKGLTGFLQKPFTPEQLREKLKMFFIQAAAPPGDSAKS